MKTRARSWVEVRTVLVVSLVALLIWVWAEGESLQHVEATPDITLSPSLDGLLVPRVSPAATESWKQGPSRQVRVQLEGTTLAVDRAQRLMLSALRLEPGVGRFPSAPGSYRLDLTQVLREHPLIRETGVTIIDVEPSDVPIELVQLIRVKIPVRVSAPGVEFVIDTVTPQEVTVTLPEAVAAEIDESTVASAALTEEQVAALRDDGPQRIPNVLIQLPAQLAGAPLVSISPQVAAVTVQVRKQVARAVLSAVPVWFCLPPTEGARWNVEVLRPILQDVEVSGPADMVEMLTIEPRQLIALAILPLSSDELERGVEAKRPVIVAVHASVLGLGDAGTPSPEALAQLRERAAALKFTSPSGEVPLRVERREEDGTTSTGGPE